jgi:long-chain acyl-CoA synthetase
MNRKLRGFKRSAVELDFNLYRVDVPVPGVSGSDLSVIDIWPEGVDQTIVFVHGYAGAAETWEHQINYFSKRYRVIAPDLRGHGQSDAPYTRYTMPELVDDINAIARHLKLPEKFVLVGHSFGGSICVEYANAHPERLEELVLIATAGEYPLPKAAGLAYRLPVAFFRPWWKYRPRWNAEIHVMKRMILNNMRQWQGWPLLRNIEVPTLIITGERDNYFPRHVFDDVGKMVPGAEVVDVGASKHKVQLERHQAVNRAIERFIGEGKGQGSWRDHVGAAALGDARPWLEAYSDGTPRTVPIPRRPLPEFLFSAADSLPRRTATLFFGQKLTYKKLGQQVSRFAHALQGLGIRPGDRVMIVLPNMPEFIIAYYSTLAVGGVAVLSNPDADAVQIVKEASQTGAKVLVTLRELGPLAEAVRRHGGVAEVVLAELPGTMPAAAREQLLSRWVFAGAGQAPEGQAAATELPATELPAIELPATELPAAIGQPIAELMVDAPEEPPVVEIASSDLAAILYTSGTTANPKGVSLSHANLVANAIQTRHWVPDLAYARETFLTVVPLLHSYGMTTSMNLPIAVGATMVLLPGFEPRQVLEHIKEYKPTIFTGVPSMYGALTRIPDARAYGLSSIKACISGASPLPVEIQEAFEKMTHGRLVEGYGLTEASPVTHANPLYGKRKAGSIGVPVPNTDAKIVDLATNEDLPPGQIGQLLVKGPQVMVGYWEKEEETEALLQEGWLDTGDVAVMDADGYFHIIGRTRDVIRAGEHTVYPRDVEELLYENNKVNEVAVVGVPLAAKDQKVKAFVVPRAGVDLSQEELLALCCRRLDEYAVPWEIEFREELPKSFTGKVVRRLLVEEE